MNNLLCKLGVLSTKDRDAQEVKNEVTNGNEKESIKKKEVKQNGKKSPPPPDGDDDDACDKYLKSLDPKDWKNQDHYRVLGLSKRRIDASESELKKACMYFQMFLCKPKLKLFYFQIEKSSWGIIPTSDKMEAKMLT